MMYWDTFIIYALVALACWTVGAVSAWKGHRTVAIALTVAGIVGFACYIAYLWGVLDRPPMRTMGETRLWYSLFLPLVGIIVYVRRHYKWILSFSTLLSAVFILMNLLKPELHTKTLMPALQSPWFAPHVIVYMFAYALLGAAFVMALWLLIRLRRHPIKRQEMDLTDNLVTGGWVFLTLGMLMGALWAKDAWGTYWAWDPKETWAAITWLAYLVYLHQRHAATASTRRSLWLLVVGFVLLQMCWWGINYLPSAQGTSVHTYNLE